MSCSEAERPAILGGTPVRSASPPKWPTLDPQQARVFQSLFETGNWGRYHGPHVPELCEKFSDYHGVKHVWPCSSGTAAVELALRGVGVGPADEVIMAGYDFKANFQNILSLQAIPVLIDLDPLTWQLDPERINAACSERTKAILISHLHGGMVDVTKLRQIAEKHQIPVIEDACQSPGATILGRKAGTWGDVGVLSFGGSKLLTAGRGGVILTDRREIVERIKRYVQRGNDAYPLSEMQAALVNPQLDQLNARNEQRRTFVQTLCSHEQELSGLLPLQIPTFELSPAYYKVGFQYNADSFSQLSRDHFVQAMRAEGIAMDAGFRGLHLIHAKRRFREADPLQEATRADAEMVILHHPVLLEGESAMVEIIGAINRIREWGAEIQRQLGPTGNLVGPQPEM